MQPIFVIPVPADLNPGRRIGGKAANKTYWFSMNRVDHLDPRQLLDFRLVLDVDGGVSLQVDGLLFVQNFVGSETRKAGQLSPGLEGESVGGSEGHSVFFPSYFFVGIILKSNVFKMKYFFCNLSLA